MTEETEEVKGVQLNFTLPLNLHRLKIKCPKCGKKGINYDDHAHAFGYKDYGFVRCRYCRSRWKAETFAAWYNKQKKADSGAGAEKKDDKKEGDR